MVPARYIPILNQFNVLELRGRERAKAVRGANFQENYIPLGKDLPAPGASASAAVQSAPQGVIGTRQTQHLCHLATDFGKERAFTTAFDISSQNIRAIGVSCKYVIECVFK